MITELANIKKNEISDIAYNFTVILPIEVEKIYRGLKLHKPCGYDSISSEHLKYASNNIYLVLSRLYSAMLLLTCRPDLFSFHPLRL